MDLTKTHTTDSTPDMRYNTEREFLAKPDYIDTYIEQTRRIACLLKEILSHADKEIEERTGNVIYRFRNGVTVTREFQNVIDEFSSLENRQCDMPRGLAPKGKYL